MRKVFVIFVLGCLFSGCARKTEAEIFVDDLMGRMTLREKIAQLDMKFGSQYCTEVHPNDNCSVTATSDYYWDKLREDFPDGLGYLHDNYSVPAVMNKLQKFFIENSRLGIPVIFTGEALHGIAGTRATVLPSGIFRFIFLSTLRSPS